MSKLTVIMKDGVIDFTTVKKAEKVSEKYDTIILNVENTKNIDKQALTMLPQNVKIRVAYKEYYEIKVKQYGNYKYEPMIYDRFELYSIIDKMEDIEKRNKQRMV